MQEVIMMGKKKPKAVKTKLLMHLDGSTIDEVGNPINGAVGVSYLENKKFNKRAATFTAGGYIEVLKNANLTLVGDMTYEFVITFPANLAAGVEQIVLSNKAGMFNDYLSGHAGWNNGQPCWFLSFSALNDKSKSVVIDAPWKDGIPHHFAASRLNGVWTIFLDGQPKATVTSSEPWNGASTLIGNFVTAAAYGLSNGGIQELRISDVARYTAAFIPSSTPFIVD